LGNFRKPELVNASTEMRKCLSCGSEFKSESASLRICRSCKTKHRDRRQREVTSLDDERYNRFAALLDDWIDTDYATRREVSIRSQEEKRQQINKSLRVTGRPPECVKYSHCSLPTLIYYDTNTKTETMGTKQKVVKPDHLELPGSADVYNLRDKICGALRGYLGCSIVGKKQAIASVLASSAKVIHSAALDVVSVAGDTMLTRSSLRKIATMCAGNVRLLRGGNPLRIWHTGEPFEQWMAVRVLGAADEDVYTPVGDPGTAFGFEILTGACAGEKVTKVFRRGVESMMSRACGFAKGAVLKAPMLVGMEMYALCFARDEDTEITLRRWYATSSQKKRNKTLHLKRMGGCKKYEGETCMTCKCGHSPKTPIQALYQCDQAIRPIPIMKKERA